MYEETRHGERDTPSLVLSGMATNGFGNTLRKVAWRLPLDGRLGTLTALCLSGSFPIRRASSSCGSNGPESCSHTRFHRTSRSSRLAFSGTTTKHDRTDRRSSSVVNSVTGFASSLTSVPRRGTSSGETDSRQFGHWVEEASHFSKHSQWKMCLALTVTSQTARRVCVSHHERRMPPQRSIRCKSSSRVPCRGVRLCLCGRVTQ